LSLAVAVLVLLAGALLGAVVVHWLARRQEPENLRVARDAARSQAEIEIATFKERAQSRSIEVELLRGDLARINQLRDELQAELARAREESVRLQTELTRERQEGQEKLDLLQGARDSLVTQFKSLANDILEEKGKRFSEQHRVELDLLLRPLGDKIQSFEKKVEDTYLNEAKERFSLAEEVRKLQTANLQISQDALNLTRALKGESKTRGNWGEVILERVLERSGLLKGREYETQVTLEGADRVRPDVVVRLPDNKHIVIDSKVSLVAYDRYYSADDEIARERALAEHLASMRRHIDDLNAKNYQGRTGLNTPDFVAMFVPIEPAYNLAASSDATLYLDAFDKKVVIVTPSTLLAMLSTVSTLWRRELQNRNALEIARRSGELYDKFVNFVDALSEIGERLEAARRAYDTALGRLSEGRGNLVRHVQDLKKLGAKAEKSLPPDLLARAGSPDDAVATASTQGEDTELSVPVALVPDSGRTD